MKKVLIFSLLIFLSLVISVQAVGITPARINLNFEPNYENIFHVNAINNNRGTNITLEPYIEGDEELAKYFKILNPEPREVAPLEHSPISFSVNLPSSINIPGTHTVFVGVSEVPSEREDSGAIFAYTRAQLAFHLAVPFPGKFAEATLTVANANVGETGSFNVELKNLGKQTINAARGTVTIQDGDETILTLNSKNTLSISPKSSANFPFKFKTDDINGGEYTAIAIMDYDGLKATDDELWRLGNLFVNLTNYTKEFEVNKINRWDIHTQSRWNKLLNGVYAEAKIIQNGEEIDVSARTPTIEVAPWEQKRLVAYWDTSGFAIGEYDAKITVHYDNRSSDNFVKIKIQKPKSKLQLQLPLIVEKVGLQLLILLIILLVIIIDIIWLVWVSKKKKKNVQIKKK